MFSKVSRIIRNIWKIIFTHAAVYLLWSLKQFRQSHSYQFKTNDFILSCTIFHFANIFVYNMHILICFNMFNFVSFSLQLFRTLRRMCLWRRCWHKKAELRHSRSLWRWRCLFKLPTQHSRHKLQWMQANILQTFWKAT